MIHISGSGADEHIELSMWLRALTAQANNGSGLSSLSLWRKSNAGRENWNAVSNWRAINADRLDEIN
jgi:hypothetical protein